MGNNQCCKCQVELRNDTWKPYCRGCYQRAYPFCDYCKNPIHKGQERIGNYHKIPCYSVETHKCCECFANINREQGDGIYCAKCYDVKNAPPFKMYVKYRDNEFSLHSRDDRVLDTLKAFSDGLYNAIQGNVGQRIIKENASWDEQRLTTPSSYWGYTKSYLDYSVKGVSNFVGRKLFLKG